VIELLPPTAQFRSLPERVYRRPRWHRAVAGLLPTRWQVKAADGLIARLPLGGLLAAYAVLGLVPGNSASSDEVGFIEAGRSQLRDGLFATVGDPVSARGPLSAYPVLAAFLDGLGGLVLVRVASLLAMLATMVVLHATVSRTTGSPRTALLAAASFAFAAGAVFAGAIGTPDALRVLALAVTIRGLVAGRGAVAAVLAAVALVFALSLDAGTVLLLPAVALLVALLRRKPDPEIARRALTVTALSVVFLSGLLLIGGPAVRDALLAGTAVPVLTAPGDVLTSAAGWFALDLAVLVPVAVGGVIAGRPGPRALAAPLVAAGLVLPFLAQASPGPAAVNRLSADAALFLAPVAGFALAALSRTLLRWVPVVAIMLAAPVLGLGQEHMMAHTWVDVRPVLPLVEHVAPSEVTLSTAVEPLRYTASAQGLDTRWESTTALAGPEVARAVADRRFALILLEPTTADDLTDDALVAALKRSADYEAEDPVPDPRDPALRWTAYRLINRLP
jgi:hypothetical protein